MRHRIGYNRLGRNVSHRQALYRSMATALFKYERIRTTKPKAKEIRRVAEKMISRARTDSVHNRRIVGKRIKDKAILAKLFTDIAPRFANRPGGYTRILKLGPRYGDASEMVLLELVERMESTPRRRKKEPAGSEAEVPKDQQESAPEAGDSAAKATGAAKAPRAAKAPATSGSTGKSSGKTSGKAAADKSGSKTSGKAAARAKAPAAAAAQDAVKAEPVAEAEPAPEPSEASPPPEQSEET
jgi:large subunit ribosomal protein L17